MRALPTALRRPTAAELLCSGEFQSAYVRSEEWKEFVAAQGATDASDGGRLAPPSSEA
jgi:hypothetical protein